MIVYLHKHNDFSELKQIMIKNADTNCFDISNYQNGFIWGQNRTIWVPDNLIEGYRTNQIYIESINLDAYFHFNINEQHLNQMYEKYISTTPYIVNAIKQKNNNDRWMITSFNKNFNKTDKRIYISLSKTKWSMNQFVWKELFPKQIIDKKKALEELAKDHSSNYYPNSFCLHLVIISADKKVIISEISGNKINDYPYTLAATIGEQLEKTDFDNKTDYNNKFIDAWIKRAFAEEFGLTSIHFDRIVNLESARILGFVEEGDIYNISIVTSILLNYSFEDFCRYISTLIITDKEFSQLRGLKISEIPSELFRHFYITSNRENNIYSNGNYHPSTAMRLFLTYSHFYGLSKFKKEWKKCSFNLNN